MHIDIDVYSVKLSVFNQQCIYPNTRLKFQEPTATFLNSEHIKYICYASYWCATACLVWTWTHCHNKGRYAWSWSETPRVSSCCSCLCLPCHNDYSSTLPLSQHSGWKSESSAQDLQELKGNNYDQTSCLIIIQS